MSRLTDRFRYEYGAQPLHLMVTAASLFLCGYALLRITEIPIETRYFDEASQIAFGPSVRYGLAILKTMLLYKLHAWGIYSSRIFRDHVKV